MMTTLEAEARISDLFHNGGKASDIRDAQADRAESLGQLDEASYLRADAAKLRAAGK